MNIGQRTLRHAIVMAGLIVVSSTATMAATPFGVGMDLASIDAQAQAGVKPDYGMVWVGTWTLNSWSSVDGLLDKARMRGVTPVVQYYYWGNDVSKSCVEYGCYSGLHGSYKSRGGWAELGRQLGDHLRWKMQGAPAIVVLETEFNKGDIQWYEPFDGYLAERAYAIRAAYPQAKVVLGFGNWGSSAWGTFDRAMAASDMSGLQGLRASTRNSESSYLGIVDATLSGAKTLKAKFGKPVFLTDIGVSSYTEPYWLSKQSAVIQNFFGRVGEFQAAGVQGLVYRSFRDSPTATTKEYFGEGERHFGLAWSGGGTKPGWEKWKSGVAAVRGGTTTTTSSSTSTSGSTAAPDAFLGSSTPLTVEAERFAYKPVGGAQGDSTASAGYRWNLWANGKITQTVDFKGAGTYEIRVRTQGQVLSNIAPHLNVYVDGVKVTSRDPWSGSWSEAVGTFTVGGATTKTITLEYTNDARTSWGDRNLLLDRVQVIWKS